MNNNNRLVDSSEMPTVYSVWKIETAQEKKTHFVLFPPYTYYTSNRYIVVTTQTYVKIPEFLSLIQSRIKM